MKTFKQFMLETYDFHKHLEKSDKPPALNHPGEIADFPGEAKRQFDNFKRIGHHDFGDGEPPKSIPGNFWEKHGVEKHWTVKEIEKDPKKVAEHLDVLHHHFPEIAKHYNMKPMTPESSEEETGYESPHK
jgi:hypothetical protein